MTLIYFQIEGFKYISQDEGAGEGKTDPLVCSAHRTPSEFSDNKSFRNCSTLMQALHTHQPISSQA